MINRTLNFKTALFTLVLILTSASSALSQGAPMQDRLKAQQVAFFTQKINLSTEEAKIFWPVYDDYSNRRETLRIEERNLLRAVDRNGPNMSDAEITDTMNKYLENQEKEQELFLTYNKKFREILPQEKVLLIYVAENQFKQYLLEQIRQNRRGNGNGRF